MSKAVLISIRPKWCELIAIGRKEYELRKSSPRLQTPFKVYVYESRAKWAFDLIEWIGWKGFAERLRRGKGKVVGEFVCNHISCANYPFTNLSESILKLSCLNVEQVDKYSAGKILFFWHITQLKIYDEPKELSEFMKPCTPDPDGVPLCLQCKRLVENYGCGGTILRPPQSWCYVEELI